MTSGSIGTTFPSFLTKGVYHRKLWDGGDGKYIQTLGFKRLKWNPYTLESESLRCTENQFQLAWQQKSNPSYAGIDPWPVVMHGVPTWDTMPLPPNLMAKALSKILEDVKNHDFNLGVNLGQLNQTVDLLSGNLRKLGQAALALKRGNFSRAARALGARPRNTTLNSKDISGRWLELQYGWMPLLSDSFEAAKAFESLSNGPRTARFRAVSRVVEEFDGSSSPSLYECVIVGHTGVLIKFELEEELSAVRQMGLLDPLSIAWELTPWSFVIDWFVPIGNYLSLLNQIPFLKGRWMVTKFKKYPRQPVKFKFLEPEPWGPAYSTAVVSNPAADRQWTLVERQPLTQPPTVPFPKFDLRGASSLRRLWNAVALGHQRFKR